MGAPFRVTDHRGKRGAAATTARTATPVAEAAQTVARALRVNDPVSRSAADLGHGAAALTLARGSLGQPGTAFLQTNMADDETGPFPPITPLAEPAAESIPPSARRPTRSSAAAS